MSWSIGSRRSPGVTAVSLTSQFPLHGANLTLYTIPGEPPVAPAQRPTAVYRLVSPGYFRAMGMPLLAGRTFTGQDIEGAPRVMIVNRKVADLYWPGASPVGRKVQLSSHVWKIVGVLGNTYDFGPDVQPPAESYEPIYQSDLTYATLVVATDRPPSVFLGGLRATVHSIAPDQPLYEVRTARDLLRNWLASNAAITKVLDAVALLAFLLAAVGVYGVIADSVANPIDPIALGGAVAFLALVALVASAVPL